MDKNYSKIEIDCNKLTDIAYIRSALNSDFATEAMINESLLRKTKFLITIQDSNSIIVGIGGIYKKYYFFSDLYIALDKKVRGKGIGNELFEAIMLFVERRNITLYIQTYDCGKYINAISLYKKHNFFVCSKYKTKILMIQRNSRKWQVLVRKRLFQVENKLRSYKRKWIK